MLIESPAGSSEPAAPPGVAARIENVVASLTLFGIMLLPLAEIGSRRFLHAAIPGSSAIVSALTLWLGMLGAAIAARDGKLLTLATGEFLPKGPIGNAAHVISATIGAPQMPPTMTSRNQGRTDWFSSIARLELSRMPATIPSAAIARP